MAGAIVRTGKRGRPPLGAVSIHLTVHPDQLAKVDAWIADQDEPLTRPEAVRRLLDKALS